MDKESAYKIEYHYDALNRLTGVRYGDAPAISYDYDAAGNLVAIGMVDEKLALIAQVEPTQPAAKKTPPPPLAPTAGVSPPSQAQPAPAQARAWYMSRQGQQFGPYTWEQLWQYAREGLLQKGDLVWHPSFPHWARAETLNGLFK